MSNSIRSIQFSRFASIRSIHSASFSDLHMHFWWVFFLSPRSKHCWYCTVQLESCCDTSLSLGNSWYRNKLSHCKTVFGISKFGKVGIFLNFFESNFFRVLAYSLKSKNFELKLALGPLIWTSELKFWSKFEFILQNLN